jgi:hypothetical protein
VSCIVAMLRPLSRQCGNDSAMSSGGGARKERGACRYTESAQVLGGRGLVTRHFNAGDLAPAWYEWALCVLAYPWFGSADHEVQAGNKSGACLPRVAHDRALDPRRRGRRSSQAQELVQAAMPRVADNDAADILVVSDLHECPGHI